MAAGGRPAGVSQCSFGSGGTGLHGSHCQTEAAVGGYVQPEPTRGSRSQDGDGECAESSSRGETHLINIYCIYMTCVSGHTSASYTNIMDHKPW